MDVTKVNAVPNPRENANLFSILFFTYTLGMFKKGYSKTLEVDDLYRPISSDKSKCLGDKLERKWNLHVESVKNQNKKPSLLWVLVATFWQEILILGVIVITMDLGIRLVQPLVLGKLLDYFKSDSNLSKNNALCYAGAIVVLNAGHAILINQNIMNSLHYGMKVRAACCALIYRKVLRLSKNALNDVASGKIVNLLSNDVSRFELVLVFIHQLWVAPTLAIIVTFFLYSEAGFAGIIGIVPVFLVVPLQSYTGKLTAKYRKQTAQKTDERVRLMDEVISGIQVIKMYAWEIPFTKIIKLARKAELNILIKSSYIRGLFMTFNLFTTRAALFCTLLAMSLSDQKITVSKVFVFMSYYNVLAQTMSSMFVRSISEVAEVLVAIKRMEIFMTSQEFVALKSLQNKADTEDSYAVCMKAATVKWNMELPDNALTDINLKIRHKKLYGVIGLVGSGKSSLLQTLLGELDIVNGTVDINGSISYASQEPWVFAATIRQNILFGELYEKKRYNEVIKACDLEKDLQQFVYGDLTTVGERGASLSGGQKARINLARAVYREADIYLLDDPLSAVDIHVGKHLYEECINGYLMNKTRILVTHQVYNLKDADQLVILANGAIVNKGTFRELSESNTVYAKLFSMEPEVIQTTADKEKVFESMKSEKKMLTRSDTISLSSTVSEFSIPDKILTDETEDHEEEYKIHVKDLQEESSKGKVKGSLLWIYLKNGSNIFFISFLLLLFIISQLLASGVDYFVAFWINIEENRNVAEVVAIRQNVSSKDVQVDKVWFNYTTELCLYVYAILVVLLFFVAFLRSMLFYKLAIWCSQQLHDTMFGYVISATMRFFDTNPSGRILNRFSKDIGSVDEFLPKAILDAVQNILMMFGSLILIIVVNPYFLIFVGIISIFFLLLRMVYLRSSKNIKRLESIMRSPVFTHLNASLQGLTTIRAYRAQDRLMSEFDKHQDYHTSAWFMYISSLSAFGFYLDFLCFIFSAIVIFTLLVLGESMLGGKVGLAITQATALTGLVQWGIRQSAEISNQLMSVERILEYNLLPKEQQPESPKPAPKLWPNEGKIEFKEVGLRYDTSLPLVLKNLNINIQPKEKVGIVGRTGAGKSSLIQALFKLAPVEGKIEIDEIDTKLLNLFDLRSKISIIPQDPVLFSGTLRYNLDPFEYYKDEELYRALEEVELKDPANIIDKLENRVMDRGSNYSVGQKQLICLARAIIRNNKILMLDEATSNVDPQSDALIQKTIRKKFADCTMLTVAHRLNTIMDSDKVLVMDQGTIAEFDHPYNLLQNTDGVFYKMVQETGKSMSEQLEKIARETFLKKESVYED